nr:hypothetical protein [Paraburkholderia terrae]
MAGGNDDAASKESWFMQKFDVDRPFTPDDPVCSAKGALVTTGWARHHGSPARVQE